MKITRRQLKQMVNEETAIIESEIRKRKSEIKEFSESRSGKRVVREGARITSAASAISQVAEDQTGKMRETLYEIAGFVGKIGETLSGLGMIQEGASVSESLPSIKELKQLHKNFLHLEK